MGSWFTLLILSETWKHQEVLVLCRRQEDTSCVNTLSRLISGCHSFSSPLLCWVVEELDFWEWADLCRCLNYATHCTLGSPQEYCWKHVTAGEGDTVCPHAESVVAFALHSGTKLLLKRTLDITYIRTFKIFCDASVRDICVTTKTPARDHWENYLSMLLMWSTFCFRCSQSPCDLVSRT